MGVTLAAIMISQTVLADQTISLHNPDPAERASLASIFDADPGLGERFRNQTDFDHLTWQKLYVSRLDLDHSGAPEMAVLIIPNGMAGSVGNEFYIWRSKDGKWVEILNDHLRDEKAFRITDRTVNGYPVLRFPEDNAPRVYGKDGYGCPECPR